jgi:hypothetical protein
MADGTTHLTPSFFYSLLLSATLPLDTLLILEILPGEGFCLVRDSAWLNSHTTLWYQVKGKKTQEQL